MVFLKDEEKGVPPEPLSLSCKLRLLLIINLVKFPFSYLPDA
ncbi:hypothetical protein DSBG_1123 [Desulfosporosinus sp. BG]|nr:hypothetical protein DSBG_1123 [Desulfosporosinus sp. BG]